MLVELPGEVGCIDPTIAVPSDEERVLSELRPVSKELGDKGYGVKRELVVVCCFIQASLGPRVPNTGWVVNEEQVCLLAVSKLIWEYGFIIDEHIRAIAVHQLER